MDSERRWLFVATNYPLDEDLTEAANNLPPEANAAIVYPNKSVEADYNVVSFLFACICMPSVSVKFAEQSQAFLLTSSSFIGTVKC